MDTILAILKSEAKTNTSLFINNDYLYHGIYIPGLSEHKDILSIIDNGILTLRDQYEKGLIPFEELKTDNSSDKGILSKFFKSKKAKENEILSNKRNNIVFFSQNKNLFNRAYDVSFVVRKDENYVYRDTNVYSEEEAPNRTGQFDMSEYLRSSSVPNDEIVAIKINYDLLLDTAATLEKNGGLEGSIQNFIAFINAIYDRLEANDLDIPIINSNDFRILDKEEFRKLRDNYERIVGGLNEKI